MSDCNRRERTIWCRTVSFAANRLTIIRRVSALIRYVLNWGLGSENSA